MQKIKGVDKICRSPCGIFAPFTPPLRSQASVKKKDARAGSIGRSQSEGLTIRHFTLTGNFPF
jgi:hypothetical protein